MIEMNNPTGEGMFDSFRNTGTETVLSPQQRGREMRYPPASPEINILANTENPALVRHIMRSVTRRMEAAVTRAPGFIDQYELARVYNTALQRAEFLQSRLPGTKEQSIALYLGYDDSEELGRPKIGEESQDRIKTAEVNRSLIRELTNEAGLLVTRFKFASLFRTYEQNAGSVEKVAELFLYPAMYHPQAEDFKALFNADASLYIDPTKDLPEKLERREGGLYFINEQSEAVRLKEADKLGDNIDLAMRVYFVVGLTENPQAIRELKGKPGWKILFPTEEDEKRLLGDIDQWYAGVGSKDGKIQKTKAHTKAYKTHKHRGLLSRFGNIYARAEDAATMQELRATVRELAGEEAEEIAFRSMRMFGVAANMGSEYYWDPDKKNWKIEQEGFPQSDDMVRIMNTREWHLKNDAAGHPCGPKSTRGKYERLATDFFSFTTVDTPKGKRSLKEMWWGYTDEPAKKLGELPWDELPKDVLGKWFLRVFHAARKGGFFDKITNISWDPRTAGNPETWEQIKKDTNILISDAVVANGWLKGKEGWFDTEATRWKIVFRQNVVSIFDDPEGRRQNMWILRNGGAGVEGEPGHTTLENALKAAKYEYKTNK